MISSFSQISSCFTARFGIAKLTYPNSSPNNPSSPFNHKNLPLATDVQESSQSVFYRCTLASKFQFILLSKHLSSIKSLIMGTSSPQKAETIPGKKKSNIFIHFFNTIDQPKTLLNLISIFLNCFI